MGAGQRTTYATLSQVVQGRHASVDYDPAGLWIWIRPSSPTSFDEDRVTHLVETDYHPQMSTNTILTLDTGRVLYVRGIADQENRQITHHLTCEEVVTP